MRLKIIAGNLIAVLVVGLASYFVVRSQIESGLASQIDKETANDRELFDRSWRLSVVEFLENVRDRAATRDVRVVFAGLDEDSRRQRAHNAAEAVGQWFRDPARGREGAPDIVAIVDDAGKVIARDKDINSMHGKSLVGELPTLRDVLKSGGARHDVWSKKDEDKLLQTGVVAIRSEQQTVIGALVVGYDLSNGLAESEARILGREVAFVADGKVYSSSLPGDMRQKLKDHLFGAIEDRTQAALGNEQSSPWAAKLGSSEYVGLVAPLAMTPSTPVAYAVMLNRSAHLELAGAAFIILILTAVGIVGVTVYGFMIGGSFLRPLERIEEGVLQVINGRTDLRIDVESAEFGGLAYRINQLINVFTGVSEEDEEGRVSQPPLGAGAWQGAAFSEGGGASGGGGSAASGGGDVVDDPAVAQQLAAEPAEQYQARIYQEYVAAKQAAGEDVSNIPQDRFIQRLQGNAKALAGKHGVPDVRFQVETRGGQVVLKPVLIR